jgi:hypothetical protein
MMIERNFDPVIGMEVYQWPEFKAFCERLGVDYEAPTTDLNIYIPMEGLVRITHEYLGDKLFNQRRQRELEFPALPEGVAESTTAHNKEFRTYTPTNPRPLEPHEADHNQGFGYGPPLRDLEE